MNPTDEALIRMHAELSALFPDNADYQDVLDYLMREAPAALVRLHADRFGARA